jgi:hypothetical protein
MRQFRDPRQRFPLAALADHQHPGGVRTGDQLHYRRCDVGKHVIDAAWSSGGAGQLGHPRCQIVVPLFGHDQSVPIRAARHTAGEMQCAPDTDLRLSFAELGNAAGQVGPVVDHCTY